MRCHWESSQRPLFVKSVWKDGYRHAILTKEDPAAKMHPKSPRLATDSLRPDRTKSKNPEDNLKIPSVQVLLANAKRLKRENSKTAPPIRDKLQKSLSFDLILRDDIKITTKNVLTDKGMHATFNCQKATFANDNSDQNNSLTERVLLWLDLAGKYSSKNNYDFTLPNNVASRIELDLPEIISLDDSINVEEQQLMQKFDNDFDPEYSILEDQPFLSPKSIMEMEEDDYRIANIETQKLCASQNHTQDKISRITKRKVHIFIPNVTDKSPECGSDCGYSNLSISK